VDAAMERLQTFMAGIPYEFADKAVELHYENNLFIFFVLVGVDARPEWHTSQGRIDLLLTMRNAIYIIELKLDGTPEEALEQIHKKDYARQFAGDPRPIINVDVSFSTKTRNISAWKTEIWKYSNPPCLISKADYLLYFCQFEFLTAFSLRIGAVDAKHHWAMNLRLSWI